MKGLVGVAIQAVVFMMVAAMLAGGLALFGQGTPVFIKAQTLGLEADRISNAAMALDSIPRGYVKIPLQGYSFDYEDDKINLSIASQYAVRELGDTSVYNGVIYSSDRQEIDNYLCLIKSEEGGEPVLEFKVDSC